MAIVPETKDWTWVLEQRCAECGFDASPADGPDMAVRIRDNAAAWRPLLGHPAVRTRPDHVTWSGLEYACHVRDVFRTFRHRLDLMLAEDDPTFPNWDQDATAVADAYDAQDPRRVADELEEAAGALADRFGDVPAHAWHRPGRRSDGARFTVAMLSRYLLHDPVHHLWDVDRGYAAIS
jgi:hypothetical protein